MENLPTEILLHITSHLDTKSITRLGTVSKCLHGVISDNELWRSICFQNAHSRLTSGQPAPRPFVERKIYDLQEAVAKSGVSDNASEKARYGYAGSRISRWDSSAPGEEIDWRSDYIGRHAALNINWIHDSQTYNGGTGEDLEPKGLAAIDEKRVIAPFGDGSIRLWDVGTDVKYGEILTKTRAGLLYEAPGSNGSTTGDCTGYEKHSGVTSEGLSVDKTLMKAYFAVGNGLIEVDLTTMKASACQKYSEGITVLSPAFAGVPLTVGTPKALYTYDPRVWSPHGTLRTAIGEQMKDTSDFQRLVSGDAGYTPLAEPLPLSILHSNEHMIHVAGRFPSILSYDRRLLPRVSSTIHSGARLSCLSIIPSAPGSVRLAAAGDYNGKGSIELYGLSQGGAALQGDPVRNRVSASRSKCLSITSQGSRMVFSDSDGMVKWVERDGSTLVRRWNINSYPEINIEALDYSGPRGGIFSANVGNGDAARRLVPMADRPDSDICVWTGEKIGMMHFGRKRDFIRRPTAHSRSSSGSVTDEERTFGHMMRRALERQADEVRFMAGLGLGRSP